MRTASCEELGLSSSGHRQQSKSSSDELRPDCLLQIFPIGSLDSLTALENSTYYIGRDRSCQFRIIDRSVSRQHAFLRKTPEGWQLMDLGSTNGTKVNEAEITKATLKHGDRVQFGTFIYQFLDSQHIEGEYHHSVASKVQQDAFLPIMNRRAFLEMFARTYRQSLYDNRPLTIGMLDLDHFKDVNDDYGHKAGDEVLEELVARIKRCCPENGTLARYGGEEFALLFEDFGIPQTLPYLEQMQQAVIDRPFLTSAGPVAVTISVGLADHDADRSSSDQQGLGLVNKADSLLYEAKRKGRNQICY